jgi:hypothetical protein
VLLSAALSRHFRAAVANTSLALGPSFSCRDNLPEVSSEKETKERSSNANNPQESFAGGFCGMHVHANILYFLAVVLDLLFEGFHRLRYSAKLVLNRAEIDGSLGRGYRECFWSCGVSLWARSLSRVRHKLNRSKGFCRKFCCQPLP